MSARHNGGGGAMSEIMSEFDESYDDYPSDEIETCACEFCDCHNEVWQFGDICDACACEHIVMEDA